MGQLESILIMGDHHYVGFVSQHHIIRLYPYYGGVLVRAIGEKFWNIERMKIDPTTWKPATGMFRTPIVNK